MQPYFVAIPYRADGIEGNAAALFFFEKQVQGPRAQIKTIQYGVTADNGPEYEKPPYVVINA